MSKQQEFLMNVAVSRSRSRRCSRGAGIRSAHPQLFNGLAPTVSLSELPPSNRSELRLAIGPLPSADAAAKLCTTLERFRPTWQPTIFAGRHLALD